MGRLSKSVRKVVRQGNLFPAVVLDTYKNKATVRLSTNGMVYNNLDVIGGMISIGQEVQVSFASGTPVVMSSSLESVVDESENRTKPLEPVGHMKTYAVQTATSGSGSGYSTVDHQYIFVPVLGGSRALSNSNVLDRIGFGTGPYSGGTGPPDYFGISLYDGTFHAFTMFATPFETLTLKITPVAQLLTQLGTSLYLYVEARAFAAYFTSYASPAFSSYTQTTLVASILPFFRQLTELEITFEGVNSGDIFYLYAYGSGGADDFYLTGYWVELIGVP